MFSRESEKKAGSQRRDIGEKDVLGVFQVPVLSLAASQSDDYCYKKAGIQMFQDIEYAVQNISPIIDLHHQQSHTPLVPHRLCFR